MGKVIEYYKINISNINVNLLKELASTLPEKRCLKNRWSRPLSVFHLTVVYSVMKSPVAHLIRKFWTVGLIG